MTYKEAIKALEKELLYNLGTEKAEAYIMAIQAMEMQVEKKPVDCRMEYNDEAGGYIIVFAKCPSCNCEIAWSEGNDMEDMCCRCGQKLDWSEE